MTERDIPALVGIFTAEPSIPEGLELSRKDRRDLEAYFDKALDAAAEGKRIVFLMRSHGGGLRTKQALRGLFS